MTSEPSPTSRQEVRVTRLLQAPRELVFKAWLDADQVAAWWAPNDYEIPRETVEIEPYAGGRIHFSMVNRRSGTIYLVRFEIVEISEPQLLLLASDPMPEIGLHHPMITRALFEAKGEDTLLTVTQTPHAEETQEGATAGWTESLGKLEQLLRP